MVVLFLIGPRSLPRSLPDCMILDNYVFDFLKSVDELFAEALRRFWTCLLVNTNSFGKLILSSELPIILGDNLKATTDLFAKYNLLSYEFDSFAFKLLNWAILYW